MSSNDADSKNCTIHVDVCQHLWSCMEAAELRELLLPALCQLGKVSPGYLLCGPDQLNQLTLQNCDVKRHILKIQVESWDDNIRQNDFKCLDLSTATLKLHVYKLQETDETCEQLDSEEQGASVQSSTHYALPSASFDGIWDSLVLEEGVKRQLMGYASSALLFSEHGVNPDLVTWNRLLLLHGPPGTGKTSLCRALAHKLTIRCSDRYYYGQLIEINSHSLFSKWFSESGKLVLKMFQRIRELVEDPQCLVFVLIDEVESLTSARTAALSGAEPSDAIRVVNALLTQLDGLRAYSNVMVLTTSNITQAIDVAFVDRADLRLFIGLPSASACYSILRSCCLELARARLLKNAVLLEYEALMTKQSSVLEEKVTILSGRDFICSKHLLKIGQCAANTRVSGRRLRKLPLLAHALFIQKSEMNLEELLLGLEKALAFCEKESMQLSTAPAAAKNSTRNAFMDDRC